MDTKHLLKKMYRYKMIYIMLIPIVVYFIVFSYYPLYLGIVNSFMASKILGGQVFVGLENYKEVISSQIYWDAFFNTVVIGVGTFAIQFLFGLVIALSLNELRVKFCKSFVQSITYLPYLLSWSIVGAMWIKILAPYGMLNAILTLILGSDYKPIIFMSESSMARQIMILTAAWKGAGYYAVLFLAAIVSIDQSIYESAVIDGASRMRQITGITIPNLVSTMKVITVLASMGILRNFDQIFMMQNSSIISVIRSLMYLIYDRGITNFKIGYATAAATLVLVATYLISAIVRRLTKYDESYTD